MATSADHEDVLNCPICFETYNESHQIPKLLPCHHTFCLQCLRDLEDSSKDIECPTCRARLQLLPGSSASLQTNFYINKIRHLSFRSSWSGDDIVDSANLSPTHQKRAASFSGVQEASDFDSQINRALEAKYQALTKLNQEIVALEQSRIFAESKLDDTFDKLHEELNNRKRGVKNLLQDLHNRKQEIIEHYIDAIKAECKELDIQRGSELQSLVQNTTGSMLTTTVFSTGHNTLTFNATNLLDKVIGDIGHVGLIDESKWVHPLVQVETRSSTACLLSTMCLTLTDVTDNALPKMQLAISIYDAHNDKLLTNVQECSDGVYTVTFRPQMSGVHRALVKCQARPCLEFSFSVNSNDPITAVSKNLRQPQDVASYGQEFFIADTEAIHRFKLDGTYVENLKVPHRHGKYTGSTSLVVSSNQILCPKVKSECGTSSHNAYKVAAFSKDGKFQEHIILDGRYRGSLIGKGARAPFVGKFFTDHVAKGIYIAANSKNQVIVCDCGADMGSPPPRILVFDKGGQRTLTFGGAGSQPGRFRNPSFVTVGPQDDILVSDSGNHRIQVFDQEGNFKHQFGREGCAKGQFLYPTGIAVDQKHNILVVDKERKDVQIFQYDGTLIGCIESSTDKLRRPLGISATIDGHVLVADSGDNNVKKYKYL